MKRFIFLYLTLILCTLSSFAQNKQNPLVDTFVKDYNTSNYVDFYNYFSAPLKEELPFAQAKDFFVEMKEKLGNIKHIEFYGLDKDKFALYKTEFDSEEVALLNIAVNEEGELEGFRIVNIDNESLENIKKIRAQSTDNIIKATLDSLENKTQIAVALIDNDKVSYYSFEKKKGRIIPIDSKNKLFGIANFTTIFTSTLLAQAEEEGKLKLTDNLNDHYDFKFNDNIKLPLISLANHSSGVPMLPSLPGVVGSGLDDYLSNFDKTRLHTYLQEYLTLDEEALKTKQNFSFLAYAMLGDLLSETYDKPYTTLVEEKIFKPYGMTSSTMLYPSKKTNLVKSIYGTEAEFKGLDKNALLSSTGGFSTLEDLTHFIQAQFNLSNKSLRKTQQPTLLLNQSYMVSLGWKIVAMDGPDSKTYFSRAINEGYSNYVGFNPKLKKGVVILMNNSSENALAAMDALTYKLIIKAIRQ